jgi:hypothetical protein
LFPQGLPFYENPHMSLHVFSTPNIQRRTSNGALRCFFSQLHLDVGRWMLGVEKYLVAGPSPALGGRPQSSPARPSMSTARFFTAKEVFCSRGRRPRWREARARIAKARELHDSLFDILRFGANGAKPRPRSRARAPACHAVAYWRRRVGVAGCGSGARVR